jgi:uncharacterized membrane protein YbhN (UPF0104 family)
MPRTIARWGRPAAVVLILGVLGWRLGAGPFLTGLASLTAGAVLAAALLTALATAAAAWRWSAIARAFGAPIPFRSAVPAYYRSQFLNSVLVGGVAGDVDRGFANDPRAGGARLGLRIVAWDRGSGQAVQLALLIVALLAVDTPLGVATVGAAGVVVAAAGLLRLALLARARGRDSAPSPFFAAVLGDLRIRLLPRQVLVPILAGSTLVTLAHSCVFLLAASITGTLHAAGTLLPIALTVQVAMALPLSLGGWGPREGVAAAAFAAAGLGAGHGLAASTAYGALALIAVLPGAVVLALGRGNHGQNRIARSAIAARPLTPRKAAP